MKHFLVVLAIAAVSCSPDSATEPSRDLAARHSMIVGGTWVTKAPMNSGRGGLGVGAVNGLLYAVGGNTASVEAYNPVSGAWSTKPSMSTSRYGHGVGVLNGILYAAGGSSAIGCGGAIYSSLEAYDPATNSWTAKAPMPLRKCELGALIGVNGLLYVVGGYALETGGRGSVEAYNPVTNTWVSKAAMPTGRGWAAVGLLNGQIYALGGVNNANSVVATVEAYDPVSNTWTAKSSMPTARYAPSAATVGTRLYAIGGLVEPSRATVDAYDPITDSWSAAPTMATPRGVLGAGTVNGVIYAVGGYTNPFTGLTTMEALTPVLPNQKPTAAAGADQVLTCVDNVGLASFDGSGSSDADGAVVSYAWKFNNAVFATGVGATGLFGLGPHEVTLEVTDNEGATASDVTNVIVTDNDAPSIGFSTIVGELWPSNHRMVRVASAVSAADGCDNAPTLNVTVTSNEPQNGTGDGDTPQDWTVVPNSNGSVDIFVRAERAGSGSGRVYTIEVSATDASGNSVTQQRTVVVPHSMKK